MILAFCDLETTGLSREHHEIIQIAGVIWDSKTDTVIERFSEYIKPHSSIPPLITQITGISNKTVEKAAFSWDVLPQFYSFLKLNKVDYIIGHNFKSFDQKFLETQVTRYKLDVKYNIVFPEIIDTLTVARDLKKRGLINPPDCKQETLAKYFNIDYIAHSATSDTEALLLIYKKMRALDPKLI